MNTLTDFMLGLDAAMEDLLYFGKDAVRETADASAETPQGLNSKFAQGYRRFAYHHMDKVTS